MLKKTEKEMVNPQYYYNKIYELATKQNAI